MSNDTQVKRMNNNIDVRRFLTRGLISDSGDMSDYGLDMSKMVIKDEDISEEDSEYVDDTMSDSVKIDSHNYILNDEDLKRVEEVINDDICGEIELPIRYLNESFLESKTFMVMNASKKVVEREFKVQRDDIEQFIEVDNSTNKRPLKIDYAKLLDRPELTKQFGFLFDYQIDIKAYLSILDKVVNDMTYIMNVYPEYGIDIFKIRTKAFSLKEKYTDKEFMFDILKIINDTNVRNILKTVVEESYELNLDSMGAGDKNKIIPDLQVTDATNKVFLEVAILERLLILPVYQYCVDTNDYFTEGTLPAIKYRFNKLILAIFNYACRYMGIEQNVDIKTKLFKIVEPRVKRTNYSNRVIWKFLSNRTLDDEVAVNKYINKIIRTIIPKLNTNSSSIAFLDVVINKMIECDFRYNFRYTYKPFGVSTTDDDDGADIDKLSIVKYHKHNELKDILLNTTIERYIKFNIRKYNITDKMIDEYQKTLNSLNEFQTNILDIYYSSKFSLKDKSHKLQMVKLLLILHFILKENKIENISKMILGKVISSSKSKAGGRTSADIVESKDYKTIHNQFNIVQQKFEKDSIILRLASVYSYEFLYFDVESGEIKELKDIDKKDLALEVFSLSKLNLK